MPVYKTEPLSLAEIFKDTGFRSDAPLFRLPLEILQLIFNHFDFSLCDYDDHLDRQYDVPEFALVSYDCYIMARSKQFAKLDIQFDRFSVCLIQLFRMEASASGAHSLSIGRFVRSILFELDHPNKRFFPDADSIRDKALREISALSGVVFDKEERSANEERAMTTLLDILSPLLEQCCPNLVLLDWPAHQSLVVPLTLWSALPSLALKYLSLRDCRVTSGSEDLEDDECQLKLFSAPCNVTSLSITCGFEWGQFAKIPTRHACFSVLNACSASLTWLHLQTWILVAAKWHPQTRFPNLRTLKLTLAPKSIPIDVLEAFFPIESERGVENFEFLGRRDDPWTWEADGETSDLFEFFSKRGRIPSLTSVRCRYSHNSTAIVMLSENPQLQHLQLTPTLIRWDSPATRFDCFPILSTFTHLTFLDVHVHGLVPPSVFDALGHITTLEHLHVGGREPLRDGVWPNVYWNADPAHTLHGLRRLDRLRTLAFWHDSYEQHPRLPWEDYYYYCFSDAQVARLTAAGADVRLEEGFCRSRGYFEAEWPQDPKFEVYVDGVPFKPSGWKETPVEERPGMVDESAAWEREHARRMTGLAELYFAQHGALEGLQVGGRTFMREEEKEAPELLGLWWEYEWEQFDPFRARFAVPGLRELV